MPAPDVRTVVLVVFDTARRDRFGAYGYPQATTPTVDALAADGLRVQTMISNAPWTLPAHASLFTGLYPSEHGAQWQTGPKLREGVRLTMAEWMKGLGYTTVCATNNGLISQRTGLARGFDRYAFRLDLEKGLARAMRRAKKAAFGGDSGGRIVNEWVRSQIRDLAADEPLFLFVNYLECHWSYAPPPRMLRQVGGDAYSWSEGFRYRRTLASRTGPWEAIARASEHDLAAYSRYYDGELANADAHLAALLESLASAGRFGDGSDALVMVTSDHGEHLGESGLADHHASLDDLLIDVPFVAHGPGIVPSGVRSGVNEFVDVLPSLARRLEAELPLPYLDGRRTDLFTDLEQEEASEAAFAEWRSWTDKEKTRLAARNPAYDFRGLGRDLVAVRDSRFKLVRAGGGAEVLFDLHADPAETTDVMHAFGEDAAALRRRLDAQLERWKPWERGGQAETTPEDQRDIERRLTELGYI